MRIHGASSVMISLAVNSKSLLRGRPLSPLTTSSRLLSSSQQQQESSTAVYRLYYNDVYKVNLPPRHRFPMKKYRQVRELVQEWISEEEQQQQQQKNIVQTGT